MFVVFLFDLSKPFPQREIQVLKKESFLIHFVLGNKKDKKKWGIDRIQIPKAIKMEICALKKEGLKEFWQKLETFVLNKTNYNEESIVTTQLRHYQLLLKTKKGVKAAQKGLKKGFESRICCFRFTRIFSGYL